MGLGFEIEVVCSLNWEVSVWFRWRGGGGSTMDSKLRLTEVLRGRAYDSIEVIAHSSGEPSQVKVKYIQSFSRKVHDFQHKQ